MPAPAGCRVTFPWGDGDHEFGLGIGELEELQEKTGAGPEDLLARLTIPSAEQGGIKAGIELGLIRPGARDLSEIHRLGLIGAGSDGLKALALVKRHVEGRPRSESYLSARAILCAAVMGVPEDPFVSSGSVASPPSASRTEDGGSGGTTSSAP
jgi:hypothetical protein